MRFPRHWARATARAGSHDAEVEAIGWSDESDGAAQAEAEQRAARIVAFLSRLAAGDLDVRFGEYPYPEGVLREVVLERFADGEGRPLAVLSRNGYGAVVLNTEDVAFVDIDVAPRGGLGRLLARLSGRPADPIEAAVARVRAVLTANPRWAARIYRTAAGLRLLMTHDRVPAADAEPMLQAFGSDPLYVTLCRSQQSFRARLTPKPWRLDLPRPPHRFPWRDAREAEAVAAWIARYDAARRGRPACRLVAEVGRAARDDRIERVVALHDRHALDGGAGELA